MAITWRELGVISDAAGLDTSEALRALDHAMAELCARLREDFESSGHPVCPDPECNYAAYENYENVEHAANCAYVKYVKAQDAAMCET